MSTSIGNLSADNHVKARIDRQFENMSPALQKAAAWLRKNTYKAVFMSIKDIALAAEVSDATVHRLCSVLGYSGFNELKKDLKADELSLRTLRRLEKNLEAPPSSFMQKAIEIELQNLQQTFTPELESSLHEAADMLISARRVYVVGWRMTLSVAHSLYYQLHLVFGNAVLIPSATEITEHLAFIGEDDVLLAMHFPRYSRIITQTVDEAKELGARCIIMTDSPLAPSFSRSDAALVAATDSPGFLDSYVTPLLISQLLIQLIALKQPDQIKAQLRKQEQLFEDFGMFRP
ncbi:MULTISPECIES: MurR/RpiR family transcriptional regulator [unclassified Paenibacillus]|uniref:MurR/RpiR family transcriptional regulator n=1 Tax=unclassified Paenibacillus TaxID=185978 RepID=UPI000BA6D791|nr:MurR/RpiR family transcriptional regulator [Paenibacillus sp. 7541]PAK53029.1 hypothetical protein CHH75_11420 [Paenibacillus sp. 7541]